MNWQPTLIGPTLRLRPLVEEDFDALYPVASDPLIWEQHPDRERYTLEGFRVYFRSGIDSKGALLVFDLQTGKVIGSSRFTKYNSKTSSLEIGYTFLTREYWGGERNRELKTLMLNHAFQFVETVYFVVGKTNFRSQQAMLKIGGVIVSDVSTVPLSGDLSSKVVFKIEKGSWPGLL